MRWLGFATVLASSLVAGFALAGEDPSKCAPIEGKARYGALGYDHYVVVDNQCSKTVACEVWTDVDPEPHHPLTVTAGQKGSVKTRVGSPASEFEAQGTCKFQ